jgi:hypothetical protein
MVTLFGHGVAVIGGVAKDVSGADAGGVRVTVAAGQPLGLVALAPTSLPG